MTQRVADLSTDEFEALVERVVERRLGVWFEQVMDALAGPEQDEEDGLSPEFAESLRRARDQAARGETTDLRTFRAALGR